MLLQALGIIAVALLPSSSALAVPVFQWLNDWQITYPATFSIGDGDAARSLASAVNADTALLKARSRADNDAEVDSLYTSDIRASRTFRLGSSPAGWDVTLSTTLTGVLSTGSELCCDPRYAAAVSASAEVRGTAISVTRSQSIVGEGKSAWTIGSAKNSSGVLSDGDYVVNGSLFTQSEAEASLAAEDDAIANFFTNIPPLLAPPSGATSGFTVNITANARPALSQLTINDATLKLLTGGGTAPPTLPVPAGGFVDPAEFRILFDVTNTGYSDLSIDGFTFDMAERDRFPWLDDWVIEDYAGSLGLHLAPGASTFFTVIPPTLSRSILNSATDTDSGFFPTRRDEYLEFFATGHLTYTDSYGTRTVAFVTVPSPGTLPLLLVALVPLLIRKASGSDS